MANSHRLGLAAFVVLLLVGSAAAAPGVPRWTDDSSLTLTPYPRSFAPALEPTNLVAQILHEVDVPTDVMWRVAVIDADGKVMRRFSARQVYRPGEARLLAPAWNGRAEGGR